MSTYELMYLALSIAAFVLFGIVLAYADWYCGQPAAKSEAHTASARELPLHNAGSLGPA